MSKFKASLIACKTLALALCTALAGCSVHPTPFGLKDGKPVKDYTAQIVTHVRCEIRNATYRLFYNMISNDKGLLSFPGTQNVLADLLSNQDNIANRNVWEVHPIAQIRASFIQESSVKLNFNLEITETNTHSLSLGISPTTSGNPFTLKLSDFSNGLTRASTRIFALPSSSISSYELQNCPGDKSEDARKKFEQIDWYYPIKGHINLIKSISAYINYAFINVTAQQRSKLALQALTEAINLATQQTPKRYERIINNITRLNQCSSSDTQCNRDKICYKGVLDLAQNEYNQLIYDEIKLKTYPDSVFTDKLTFTTNISTGINPSLEFNPLGKSFRINGLGYAHNPGRKDMHEVSIALSPPARNTYNEIETDPVKVKLADQNSYQIYVSLPQKPATKTNFVVDECLPLPRKKRKPGNNFVNQSLQQLANQKGLFIPRISSPQEQEKKEQLFKAERQENNLIQQNRLIRGQ